MNPKQNVILIVDDNAQNLQVLFEILRQALYTIYVAQDGEAALSQAQEIEPDLILLDVTMPGIDGFEVCRRLKAQPSTQDIPVIFLTVLDDTTNKVRGFDVGGVDYLHKPIDPVEVLARVNTHLTIKNLRQDLAEKNEILQAQISDYTAALQLETERRQSYQEDRQELLQNVYQQNETLGNLLSTLLQEQNNTEISLRQELQERIQANLDILFNQLQSQFQALPDDASSGKKLSKSLDLLAKTQESLDEIINPTATANKQLNADQLLDKLSDREQEVLTHVFQGKTSQEIGTLLNISDKTVRVYRSRIMSKLNVNNVADLMRLAVKYGLLS